MRLAYLSFAISISATALGCGDAATVAQVDNGYPSFDGGAGEVTVYRAWWSQTAFLDPVAAGASSDLERTVPETDYVYAVLARDYDPASGAAPTKLVAVRSSVKLTAARGDTLHLVVTPSTVVGDCAAGTTLSQDEADLITTRLFPGEFSGMTYDARTCTLTAPPADAQAD